MLTSQLVDRIINKHRFPIRMIGQIRYIIMMMGSRLTTYRTDIALKMFLRQSFLGVITNRRCHSIRADLHEISSQYPMHKRKHSYSVRVSLFVYLPKVQPIAEEEYPRFHQPGPSAKDRCKAKKDKYHHTVTNKSHNKGCVVKDRIPLVHHTRCHGFQGLS